VNNISYGFGSISILNFTCLGQWFISYQHLTKSKLWTPFSHHIVVLHSTKIPWIKVTYFLKIYYHMLFQEHIKCLSLTLHRFLFPWYCYYWIKSGMTSSGITLIPNFIEISQMVQKLKWGKHTIWWFHEPTFSSLWKERRVKDRGQTLMINGWVRWLYFFLFSSFHDAFFNCKGYGRK
jgi:hypothetical protein